MNHDDAHCLDLQKSCPDSCYRAKLTRDLKKRFDLFGVPVAWTHFRGTQECKRKGMGRDEHESFPEESVPSASPERKKGQWIGIEFDGYADGYPVYDKWECSVCGREVIEEENFCPDCGADMRGEEDG